jgi:hypothetical protein
MVFCVLLKNRFLFPVEKVFIFSNLFGKGIYLSGRKGVENSFQHVEKEVFLFTTGKEKTL